MLPKWKVLRVPLALGKQPCIASAPESAPERQLAVTAFGSFFLHVESPQSLQGCRKLLLPCPVAEQGSPAGTWAPPHTGHRQAKRSPGRRGGCSKACGSPSPGTQLRARSWAARPLLILIPSSLSQVPTRCLPADLD